MKVPFKKNEKTKTIREIQVEHKNWASYNFPTADYLEPYIGMVEELGELSHAILKDIQKIRGDEEIHTEEAKDAIGDLLIFLIHFCNLKGWDLQYILELTWEQVKQRNWQKYPETGLPPKNTDNSHFIVGPN